MTVSSLLRMRYACSFAPQAICLPFIFCRCDLFGRESSPSQKSFTTLTATCLSLLLYFATTVSSVLCDRLRHERLSPEVSGIRPAVSTNVSLSHPTYLPRNGTSILN